VARGGSGAEAPPLAARSKKVAEKIPGTKITQYYFVPALFTSSCPAPSGAVCPQISPKHLNASSVYFG